MSFLAKVICAVKALKENGFQEFVSCARNACGIPDPHSAKNKWTKGLESEIQFWDDYYRTKGLQWADSYNVKFDPELPLQPRPAALLPLQTDVHILDVGAGPQTYLGKVCEGKSIKITAVDPLADEYEKIFEKYSVKTCIQTQKLAAEDLTKAFPLNSFDLVCARNCIDHAYDPELAILQMLDVVKRGCYVLLEHKPNEAENENYVGLHQWNLSMSKEDDFLLSTRSKTVNLTNKYAKLCTITCELVREGRVEACDWLITRIQKK